MKQIFTITALMISMMSSQAQTTIRLSTWWGTWNSASSWDLNRLPASGDRIIIPAGKGVHMSADINLNNVTIVIEGRILLEKKIALNAASALEIANGGILEGWNADRANETITIGGVKKFDEKTPRFVYGVQYANSATGASPLGFTTNALLPVTFTSFYVSKSNNNVLVSWSTANEVNNNNFEIERSTDGSTWSVIAVVMGAGTVATTSKYNYTDKNISAPVVYYRLRQVDIDGKATYSLVKTISIAEKANAAKIYASGKTVKIEFNSQVEGAVSVRLLNMNGQVVAQKKFENGTYQLSFDANNTNTGAYIVQVTDAKGLTSVSKIML